MPLTGECFCGQVKYRIDGELHRARSCHCSRCRKAFSAQASAYAEVDAAAFVWLEGEDLLTDFVDELGNGKRFCKLCGSTLCGVVGGKIHGIALGCLNEDPGVKLEAHIFVGAKAAWEDIPDTVPQYETFPPDWK